MKNTINGPRHKDYIRGFGFQGGGSTSFNMNAPGYGQAFKKGVLDPVTSVNLVGFGEVLPRFDNFVAIDPNVVDIFGIPVLRINMSWGENEKKMIPDMAVTAAQMMEAAGAKNIQPFTFANRIPGFGIHEMGTARMGSEQQDVGAQPVPADARHQQPLRHGRLVVCLRRLPEPDAHDHGAGRARLRLSDGRDEEGQRVAQAVQAGRLTDATIQAGHVSRCDLLDSRKRGDS